MKPKRKILTILLCLFSLVACSAHKNAFQNDADLLRLEHLAYWSGLIEKYHEKHNAYPLSEQSSGKNDHVLIKIATQSQTKQLSSFMKQFKSASMKEFINELESGLQQNIEEKYDIQKIPTQSPVGYFYFVNAEGYALWTTCITCGTTKVSTLLLDGITPTVNIVSPSMKGKVTKALTRNEMLNHPIFQSWVNKPFNKEAYVRGIVRNNINDSKK